MSGARLEVALETSSRSPSVAARLGGRLLERGLDPGQGHASDLLPSLAGLLEELGARPADLGAVFVGRGPGSYTGLRVGLATALGLARGSACDVYALSSLEVLAWEALLPGQAGAFVLDARQGELYLARYARDAAGLHELLAPCVVRAEDLDTRSGSAELLFADQAALDSGALPAGAARLAPTPRAAILLERAAERMAVEGPLAVRDLAPLYLRPFGARKRRT